MWSSIRAVLGLFIGMTVLTGVAYPLAVTGIGQLLFPRQANGSLIVRNGVVIGSSLIGQSFTGPRYFWGRPSATTPPYNGSSSSGSNLAPTNPDLQSQIQKRVAALRAADPTQTGPVPVDLVTASGSGLDPEISVAAARYQIDRVARGRGLDPKVIAGLVDRYTRGRTFGILGEPVVNVLELNLALDDLR